MLLFVDVAEHSSNSEVFDESRTYSRIRGTEFVVMKAQSIDYLSCELFAKCFLKMI